LKDQYAHEIGKLVRYIKPGTACTGAEGRVIPFGMDARFNREYIFLRFDAGATMLARRQDVEFLGLAAVGDTISLEDLL